MPPMKPEWLLPGPERFRGPRVNVVTQPEVFTISPNAGRTSGGTAVTITGLHFRNQADGTAPTVTIGGEPATSVVVVSETVLTCVTGAVADSALADVTVTIEAQNATLYGAFTYFEGTIVSVTPRFGPIVGGTDVIVEGFNFLAGSVVLFDGEQATDIVFIDSQHIACKTPPHAVGFVDVEIVEPQV